MAITPKYRGGRLDQSIGLTGKPVILKSGFDLKTKLIIKVKNPAVFRRPPGSHKKEHANQANHKPFIHYLQIQNNQTIL